MPFSTLLPPAPLSHLIQGFWAINQDPVQATGCFRPLTDGYPGLLIHMPQSGTLIDQEGKALPALCLYGQTIKPREIYTHGPFNAIGVRLHPAALPALFAIDADELTDTCLDLQMLTAPAASHLLEQLINTPSTDYQFTLLSGYLLTKLRDSKPLDQLTEYVVAEITRMQGQVNLRELQRQLRTSERSIERRFRRDVGISPILFARICRFQAALAQVRQYDYDKLSDVAFDQGYADQSHFIRSFREFTGCTPQRYHSERPSLIDLS